MTFEERKAATVTVALWIEEFQSERHAHDWAWECTPFPCGLPTDEQLDEGLRIATGELRLEDLLAKVYRELDEAMEQYNRERSA